MFWVITLYGRLFSGQLGKKKKKKERKKERKGKEKERNGILIGNYDVNYLYSQMIWSYTQKILRNIQITIRTNKLKRSMYSRPMYKIICISIPSMNNTKMKLRRQSYLQ